MSAAGVCFGGYDDVSVLKELVDAVERAAFVYLCLDFALSVAGGFGEALCGVGYVGVYCDFCAES